MAASVQFRPQNRDLGVVMREVDEDLDIFLGMQNVEKERNEELDDSKGVGPKHNTSDPDSVQISADVNTEIEKNDYDFCNNSCALLITQPVPDTSLLPSVEVGVQDCEAISLKSKLTNTSEECAPVRDNPLQLPTSTKQRPLSSRDRKPIVPAKSKGSRASTPTSISTSIPVISSKSAPRSSTPTRKPSTPTTTPGVPITVRSSSGRKMGPVMKNPVPSRGTSPTVKSRPSKLSEMLSLSHDATQISMPKRPSSASRGRPAAHLPSSNGKPRQKSCSPAKVRVPVVNKSGSKMILRSRGGDDVNPVLMGTKMVERVVNMRKLAPPKQDEYVSNDNVKKSNTDKGFGRSLSKKSLDMAIRHMDIRRSISNDVAAGLGKSSSFDVSSSSQTSSTDSSKSTISIGIRNE